VEPPPNTEAVLAPLKLQGGECVGPAALDEGWKLYKQRLDIDDTGAVTAMFLLRTPEPEHLWFSSAVKHDGLIDAQVRDLTNYPDFSGRRTYDDVIRETARRSVAPISETFGDVTLAGYRLNQDTQLFIVNDPAQTLLTCNPPGGVGEPECKVTTDIRNGRYRMTTAMTYDRRGQFKAMVEEATGRVEKAFVPCP
jgi:hypothetical protein